MDKILAKTASGIFSALLIVIGTKALYREIPKDTRKNIEQKAKSIYKVVKDDLKNRTEPI